MRKGKHKGVFIGAWVSEDIKKFLKKRAGKYGTLSKVLESILKAEMEKG